MAADYIQLVGTDVPGSYGSCCFSGQIHHEALRCPTEWTTTEEYNTQQEQEEKETTTTTKRKTTLDPFTGDGQLLFFNCPEGTQRFGAEANLRLVRTRGFFFTRWAATTVMGMPGLLFTVNDAGVRHANFFGPSTSPQTVDNNKEEETFNNNNNNNNNNNIVVRDPWNQKEKEQTGVLSLMAGLSGMLDALRRHYFWYRKMRFQQICVGHTLRKYKTSLPYNDVFEIPLPTITTQSHLQLQSSSLALSSPLLTSPSEFITLALLLSPTSALMAFRIPSPAVSSAEVIYGYVIIHAPAASFDPRRAKALGVPPGPLYGQLKQGNGVWIDKPSAADVGSAEGRCYIDPHSVKQATVGSRRLYVSLVLDGNNCDEVATAMEGLFGRAVMNDGDNNNNNNNSNSNNNSGQLRHFLQQWQPSLLYCDDHASDISEEEEQQQQEQQQRKERSMELVHIVHVQHAEFFSKMGLETLTAAQTHYITSIFAHVREDIRIQAVSYVDSNISATNQTDCLNKTPITTHHFCAAIQEEFSAFPTALTHRYHLNSIAPGQFPIPFMSSEGKSDTTVLESELTTEIDSQTAKKGSVWPYCVKHQLIPAGATTPIVDSTHALAQVSPLSTTTGSSSSVIRGVNNNNSNSNKNSGGNGNNKKNQDKKRDMPGLLRYPTAHSAVAMLSPQFRATIAEVHQQQQQQQKQQQDTVLTSATPLNHNNNNNNTNNHYYEKDGGGALTFLGTGSAVPSKYRNVSGTYLEVMYNTHDSTTIPRRVIIVLDFGEGSAGQLAMQLGSSTCTQALRCFMEDLTLVFISHSHADHHLGLMSLLELRHRILSESESLLSLSSSSNSVKKREPLLVVCPQEVYEFLLETWGCCSTYRQWFQQEVVFDIIPAERCRVHNHSNTLNDINNDYHNNNNNSTTAWTPTTPVYLPRLNALCTSLQHNTHIINTKTTMDINNNNKSVIIPPLWAAEVFPVHHPANAHALLIRFPAPAMNGTSRVMLFSGDTRPSPFLIERCHQFTQTHPQYKEERKEKEEKEKEELFLCLHEATFGEGCEDEAIQKCHSTLPEALQVAAAIHARHVVLNHFSQRYPKLPGLMKSQLDGKDVDLQGKRRRPRLVEVEVEGELPCRDPAEEDIMNINNKVSEAEQQEEEEQQEREEEKKEITPIDITTTTSTSTSVITTQERKMCFGFDFMRLSFASMESGETARLTPVFVQLLEEYESWGVGTTKRLRE